MRRLSAIFVLAFLSTAAMASRGRPVADLRFGDHVFLSGGFVASDGKDFLLLATGRGAQVYVQRVAGGTPVGPALAVGAGTAQGIVWTGADYLIAWSTPTATWTAHVSRRGALLDGSQRLAAGYSGFFASNDRSAVVVARVNDATIVAQPLDLGGRSIGAAVTLNVPREQGFIVGPSANGFAIVSTGYASTWVWRLTAEGAPLGGPLLLEGPYEYNTASYHSGRAVISTDGTDTLIVFAGEKSGADTELKTAIVGPDGSVRRAPHTICTRMGTDSLQPAAAVWTGSEYGVALAVSDDASAYDPRDVNAGLLRLGTAGEPTGAITYVTLRERRKEPIGLGWNGSDYLVPWHEFTEGNDDGGVYCAAVPSATMSPTAPATSGSSLDSHAGLRIAAKNGQYLAAWIETGAATTVRASRVDAAGNFLDGEGIVLATLSSVTRYLAPGLAIDSDGTNWLVLWANGGVMGRRISPAGSLLDAQPFAVPAAGYRIAVRWNGSNYVVVAASDSLNAVSISRDGSVTSSHTLVPPASALNDPTLYFSPGLVVSGGEMIAVYMKTIVHCYVGTPGGCDDENSILGFRLDSSGNAIGAPFLVASDPSTGPMIASDGTRNLVAWSAYDWGSHTHSMYATFLSGNDPQKPFSIGPGAFVRDLAFDGSDFIAVFDTVTAPSRAGIVRVTAAGVPNEMTLLQLSDGETASRPVIAAGSGMAALVGYVDVHPAWDSRPRSALLFSTEIQTRAVAVPRPPSIAAVTRLDNNTIDVRWTPAAGAIGTQVELQLDDGAYRTVGVAGGGVSSARISLAGLEGNAVRLYAWNTAGVSAASASVPIGVARPRAVRTH